MKIENDELEEITGRPVDRDFRLMIIKESEETGKPIAEIADKYSMPPLFILDDNGMFVHNGNRMTPEQFNKKWPFRRFVTITTEAKRKKYQKNI